MSDHQNQFSIFGVCAPTGFTPGTQDPNCISAQQFQGVEAAWGPAMGFTGTSLINKVVPNVNGLKSPHDPSHPAIVVKGFPSQVGGISVGPLGDAPTFAPPFGTDTLTPSVSTGPNPYNACLPGIVGFNKPQTLQRTGVPVDKNRLDKCHIPKDYVSSKVYYGIPPDNRNVKWKEHTGVPTAESTFGSFPLAGMLGSLPGMIMSLASSFGGLSSQQKQQIQNSVGPENYGMIEAIISTSTDIGDYNTVSINDRVDANTFANNMVSMLSNCKTHLDVVTCLSELRSNTQLHGKDKLPPIEFTQTTTFGPVGLIIDGHGNIGHNVSSQVIDAAHAFVSAIAQNVNAQMATSAFKGHIRGNILSVSSMAFGKLERGSRYIIQGTDVSPNTYIMAYQGNSNGDVGNYTVSVPSYTNENTSLVVYTTTTSDSILSNTIFARNSNTSNASTGGGGGGGGGLGGLIGMIPGLNVFGEVSKLIGEATPTMTPMGATRVQKTLATAQASAWRVAGNALTFAGQYPIKAYVAGALGGAGGFTAGLGMLSSIISSATSFSDSGTSNMFNYIGSIANTTANTNTSLPTEPLQTLDISGSSFNYSTNLDKLII